MKKDKNEIVLDAILYVFLVVTVGALVVVILSLLGDMK